GEHLRRLAHRLRPTLRTSVNSQPSGCKCPDGGSSVRAMAESNAGSTPGESRGEHHKSRGASDRNCDCHPRRKQSSTPAKCRADTAGRPSVCDGVPGSILTGRARNELSANGIGTSDGRSGSAQRISDSWSGSRHPKWVIPCDVVRPADVPRFSVL